MDPAPDPSIIKQKELTKPGILLFCDFFLLLNVPSKSTCNKQKNLDPDPDPHQNVMDPQH